ncbi:RNA-directed DNA polymerase, eukaryota, reverse transcriptase zinc-binding domain protein [Tanacetum coccineum]
MEIFNLIMMKKVEEAQNFKYHFGCKEIKLTNLCFADDLLVVCNGDKDSLEVVKSSLNEFSLVSGLFPNLSKSTIFFGSINEKERSELLKVLPFQCGKLPMKYLGVLLLTKRLGIKDCQSFGDMEGSRAREKGGLKVLYRRGMIEGRGRSSGAEGQVGRENTGERLLRLYVVLEDFSKLA